MHIIGHESFVYDNSSRVNPASGLSDALLFLGPSWDYGEAPRTHTAAWLEYLLNADLSSLTC